MSRYFLGVDVGGTKSHAVIADENGNAIGFGAGSAGNPETWGYDGLANVLQTITGDALRSAGIDKRQLTSAGFGIAGYDWPGDDALTAQAIRTLNLNLPFAFVNDSVIALLAGATEGWGVTVIAGTGCNCRGRDQQGREGRVAGEGQVGEDGGSGGLVRKAIDAVTRAWTMRGPETALTQALIAHVGATDVVDLLEGICRHRYRLGSNDVPIVFEVAALGDAVAIEAVKWAGRELGSYAVGVIHQLNFEKMSFEVVLAGSFYKGSPLVAESLKAEIDTVAPKSKVVRLTAPPVVGGVVLAKQEVKQYDVTTRQRLIETISAFVPQTAQLP
jgi:N-acetylglucosamine kinase-like BadF-type ATPase